MEEKPLVGVVMGSQSDWDVMQHAVRVLLDFGVPHERRVVSAHRTPDQMFEYAETARERGLACIIAGAGGAAHLPGMIASKTTLPVLGVPVPSRHLAGQDSLDLHGLTGDEAVAETAVFLAACRREGRRCVRIVHGKGLRSPGKEPVLKRRIRKLLTRRDEVLAFAEPRALHGGGGAVIVLLQG